MLHRRLDEAGIEHRFELLDGDHGGISHRYSPLIAWLAPRMRYPRARQGRAPRRRLARPRASARPASARR
jgi:hypothetical protein